MIDSWLVNTNRDPSPFSGAEARPEERVVLAIDGNRLLRTVFAALVVVSLLWVYLDVVVTYYEAIDDVPLQDLCNLVVEGSMGAWFSSVQTLLVGIVLLLIAARESASREGRHQAIGWGIVALFFMYMAFDDGSGFHEAIGTSFENAFRSAADSGAGGPAARLLRAFPSYAWQILFVPPLGALGLFTVVWSFREMRRRSSRAMVLSGILCFVLAVALDFVEGIEVPYIELTARLGFHEDTIPHVSGLVEETLENFGTTLLLTAYLSYLLAVWEGVELRQVSRGAGSRSSGAAGSTPARRPPNEGADG